MRRGSTRPGRQARAFETRGQAILMIRPSRFQQEILVNSYLIFLCTGLVREAPRASRARDEAAIRATRQAQKDRASLTKIRDCGGSPSTFRMATPTPSTFGKTQRGVRPSFLTRAPGG